MQHNKQPGTMKNEDDNLEEFGFSKQLINYFPANPPLRNTHLLNEMKNRYVMIDHPVAIEIVKLLSATIQFRSASDPVFKEMRDKTLSDASLVEKLNAIGRAMTQYRERFDSQQLTVFENQVYHTGLEFCMASIADQLARLKQQNDRYYVLYNTRDNELKKIMPPTNDASPAVNRAP